MFKNNINSYYTYVYLDPRKFGRYCYKSLGFLYEPFYVGKGYGDQHNNYCKNKINKILKNNLNPIIVILKTSTEENKIFEHEKQMIKEIGRFDLKNGPLTNMTNGGEGLLNPNLNIRKKMPDSKIGIKNPMFGKVSFKSEEIKRKISLSHKGKKLSEETKNKISCSLKGTVLSDKTKDKISLSRKGKVWSSEMKAKVSGKNNPRYGKKHSETTRLKMAEKKKGIVCSEETRRKMSKSRFGKVWTEEMKNNASI